MHTTETRKFLWGFNRYWYFGLHEEYYDGPYWILNIGFFCAVWSWDGLPYIFQDRD